MFITVFDPRKTALRKKYEQVLLPCKYRVCGEIGKSMRFASCFSGLTVSVAGLTYVAEVRPVVLQREVCLRARSSERPVGDQRLD
jgi:hypothetical protein